MLIEARVQGKVLYIDAEPSSGIDKGQMEGDFHPEKAFDNVLAITGFVASQLGEAAASTGVGVLVPARIEAAFGIKIDGNGVVSVARHLDDAQFRIRVEWVPNAR